MPLHMLVAPWGEGGRICTYRIWAASPKPCTGSERAVRAPKELDVVLDGATGRASSCASRSKSGNKVSVVEPRKDH